MGGVGRADSADLHMHSVSSDGEWPPARLVEQAGKAGLRAIALTDHDTTAGLAEAMRAGAESGLEVIPGAEISTWQAGLDWHVLAYGFDPEDAGLGELFRGALEARRGRAECMVDRMTQLGRPITMDAVLAEAAGGAIGRPHVARAVVKAGHAASIREAFDRFLGDGKPAHVEKKKVSPEEAVEKVHAAGGVTVAAHPGCYGGIAELEPVVAAGLDGVEVEHTLNDAELRRSLVEYADARGLLKTGGSDFHGPGAVSVGDVRIPYGWVEEMKERIASRSRPREAR